MLSIPHLIVIFIVALVVFGPEKIPELARNLGKIMAEFRRVTGDLRGTFEGHLRDLEREADLRRAAPPPAAPAASAVAPTAMEQPEIAPPTPAPGTVPSKAPNVAAITGTPENVPAPEREANPIEDPDSRGSYTKPGDPMHDPYLMSMDFPEHEPPNGLKPAERPAEPAPQSEHESQRVIDGDRRVS
jgi:TatA/E family protein of Tat protein translocase